MTTTLTTPQTAAVVLLHGSASSGQMWRRYADRLVGRRVVAPDLIGYGRAPSWPAGARLGLDDEVARLREVIAADGPIHLVGYSYGGAVALAFAAQDPAAVASLTLIEPVAFFVLRYARDAAAYAEAAWIRDAFFGDLARGRAETALRSFFDYWTGAGSWEAMAPPLRQDILARAGKVRLDWEAVFAADPGREALTALTTPTLLVHGAAGPRSTTRVIAALGDVLPAARVLAVPGANHLVPFTHESQLSDAMLDHWRRP